jgi:hypothetical protein
MLYHASKTQGLKILDPGKTRSTHLKSIKPYVYATDDKSYAAGFCFEWSSKDGIRFGQWEDDGPWVLEIPRKHMIKLKAECSIYTISDSGFRKVRGVPTPEFYSKGKVKVKGEEKYKSALKCLQENGVEIEVI